jgi:hypothetical protein
MLLAQLEVCIVAINRISRLFDRASADQFDRVEAIVAPVIPAGFTACPPQFGASLPWQQALYHWAYQQAIAASIYRVLESRFRRLGLG